MIEAFENSVHEIDNEYKRVMSEVLESGANVGDYELPYHLDNPDRP